ncbi:hypothetical protein KR222_011860, partial [Zaprionus bogoriensis]
MTSNLSSHKPNNGANTRPSHKSMKVSELSSPMQRVFPSSPPLPTVISVNAKDSHKDNAGKKLTKAALLKTNTNSNNNNNNPKQSNKRMDITNADPTRAAISIKIQSIDRHFAVKVEQPPSPHQSQTQQHQQQQHQQQHQTPHVKQSRKSKVDAAISKTRDLRSAVIDGLTDTKAPKEAKPLEKPEAPPRPMRTKNQSHNTKVFFDKYLKFAYDLSTPSGVRQLEEHFFPTDPHSKHQPGKSAK